MPRLTAKDFPQELLDYYDFYAHGKINKREFLSLAARYAVGGVTALALFNLLKPNYALAEQVKFTDPDIVPEYIRYPSPNGHGEVRGYLVKPAKVTGKVPAVVVVHENRGLNPYIEDVARRLATEGFLPSDPQIAYQLSRRAVIGAEYRTKPDNLAFAREDDWLDLFAAYALTKNLTVTAAYVDLGSIATFHKQRGGMLSAQFAF